MQNKNFSKNSSAQGENYKVADSIVVADTKIKGKDIPRRARQNIKAVPKAKQPKAVPSMTKQGLKKSVSKERAETPVSKEESFEEKQKAIEDIEVVEE